MSKKIAKATKAVAARKYHWHYSFRVGGRKRGYDCKIEVKAETQKRAAIKVRQRIKAMVDVDPEYKLHFSEVVKGLPVLPSEGHNEIELCKRNRPAPLIERKSPKLRQHQQRCRTLR